MSATAFERALDEMMFERLCRHEAGHLAAAILLGLDVVGADAKRTYLSSPPSDLDEAAGAVDYRAIRTTRTIRGRSRSCRCSGRCTRESPAGRRRGRSTQRPLTTNEASHSGQAVGTR
jgi:hypothetical protein